MKFSALDWVFSAVIFLLAVRCMMRGLVRELSTIAAGIVGLGAGLMFGKTAARFLVSVIPLGRAASVAGFVVAFLAGFLLVLILGLMLRQGLEAARLTKLDNLLGLAGGLTEGFAVVSFVLVLLTLQPYFDPTQTLNHSWMAGKILPVISPFVNKTIVPILSPEKSRNPDQRTMPAPSPSLKAPATTQPASRPGSSLSAPESKPVKK